MKYSAQVEGVVLGTGTIPPAGRGGMAEHRGTGAWSSQESSLAVFTFSGKYSAVSEEVGGMLEF